MAASFDLRYLLVFLQYGIDYGSTKFLVPAKKGQYVAGRYFSAVYPPDTLRSTAEQRRFLVRIKSRHCEEGKVGTFRPLRYPAIS